MGRKPKEDSDLIRTKIIELRKHYLSVSDIKTRLDGQGIKTSERHIYNVIQEEGFARLPKRSQSERNQAISTVKIIAPKSAILVYTPEQFSSDNAALLCFLPYIAHYNIDKAIDQSQYPGTKSIPRINAILSFVALKLCNIRRYSADELWCMDRGFGLFSGLNVLPKSSWFSSYSHGVTGDMNLAFLQSLNKIWEQHGLLGDTANLDFVAIPYWGEESHLEKNWSGTRKQALPSILAAIAHDPDTGIMTYGNTDIRHKNESNVVIEFLDFYRQSSNDDLKYLVFDSKFTTYENLYKLDEQGIKFITIRRRGQKIVADLEALPATAWKTYRVMTGSGKLRQVKATVQSVRLIKQGKEVRQIAMKSTGKTKPALIITNDMDLSVEDIIRKYARRWLVEKNISEQTHFFHLNRLSSSVVIKVDFDLVMTVLAHNIYRLITKNIDGYQHSTAQTVYEKFIANTGHVSLNDNNITVTLKKKRNLPLLLNEMQKHHDTTISWIENKKITFQAATHS